MRLVHLVVGPLLVLSVPVLAFELAVQVLIRDLPRPPPVHEHAPALLADALWLVEDGPPVEGVETWWLGNAFSRPAGSAACQLIAGHVISRSLPHRFNDLEWSMRRLALGVWFCRHESAAELKQLLVQESYFGHEATGPRAAAKAYFHRSPEDLTVAEVAVLAGLPQLPQIAADPARLRARRDAVLAKMQRAGLISTADEVGARNAPPDLKPPPRIRH